MIIRFLGQVNYKSVFCALLSYKDDTEQGNTMSASAAMKRVISLHWNASSLRKKPHLTLYITHLSGTSPSITKLHLAPYITTSRYASSSIT